MVSCGSQWRVHFSHFLTLFLAVNCDTSCTNYQHCEFHPGHKLDCFSRLSKTGRNAWGCQWQPGISTSKKTYTLIIIQQDYCTTHDNITGQYKGIKIFESKNMTAVVVENPGSQNCTKAIFEGTPRNLFRCGPPVWSSFERNSSVLDVKVGWLTPEKKCMGDYTVRYKAMDEEAWKIPSRGSRVDRLNPHLIYVVQIKCAPYDRCSQCPWSDWYIIPPELKTQPTLVSVEKVDHPIAEGNRLVSLTWKAEETERPHGYFVSLQKASREPPSEGFNTSAGAITLLLSCSAYILNIRAFNNVSVSPALGQTITSCEGATSWDARRLNVTVHSNTSFTVAWEPQLSDHYVCYSVEWSRKNQQKTAYLSFFEDEQRNRTVDFTEPLEPYRRYVLSLHTRVNKETCNLEHINGSESTFGSVPFYFMEGSPISAPANMSYYNVTSSSLGLQWSPIPEEDLQGFLLGYYVYYKEYKQDARTAEKVVTVDADLTSCVVKALKPDTVYQVEVSGFTRAGTGVRSTVSFKTDKQVYAKDRSIIYVFVASIILMIVTCPILQSTKAIFWPSIPNPENSNVIKKIEKSCEIELLEPLQTLKVEEWHTNGLQFIEEETVVRLSLPNLFAAEKKEGLTLEDVQEDTIKDMLDPPALLDLDGLPNPLTAFTCGYTTLEMFQQNVTFQCSQTISQEAEDQMQDEIKPVVDYIRQLSSTPSFDLSKTVNF